MMHESSACASQRTGMATAVSVRMSRATKRAALAALEALWKASEANCEVTLTKYSHLIERPIDGR